MYEDIVNRLASLGYSVDPVADDWVLNFLTRKVTETIKNECNIDAIPDGLHYVAVDMVCGGFLSAKNSSGQMEGFNAEKAIKQIKEGDTAITYAVSDSASGIDILTAYLTSRGKSQLVTFRRFAW